MRAYSPNYAAPEQIAGEKADIRSDIYSLGVLLSELLHDEIPRDIAAIANKCQRVNAEERYDSVDALWRDIDAFLNRLPVSARAQTRRYRSARFMQRNKLLVAGTAVVILGLGVGLGVALWQFDKARTEATRAQQVTTFLKGLFERAGPYNSGEQDVTVLQLMDDAAGRVDTELEEIPDVQTEVKQLIASGYHGIGEFDRSYEIREQALEYWRANRDEPHEEIVAALHALGEELIVRGEYDEAAACIARQSSSWWISGRKSAVSPRMHGHSLAAR